MKMVLSLNLFLLFTVTSQIYSTSTIMGPLNNLQNLILPPNCNTSTFINWARDIIVDDIYTINPSTRTDLLSIINWASVSNYTIRPSGFMHTWSPLTVTKSELCSNTILVKTQNFKNMNITKYSNYALAYVEAGASMDSLLSFLESNGYGFTSIPAPGDISIGGVLAVAAHGAAVPTTIEDAKNLYTFGALSNSVVALTAVVYDQGSGAYILKTFSRSDPEIAAFLTNLGKTFIVDVTFQVLPNNNVRCQSFTNITSAELFADPKTVTLSTNTFSKMMLSTGRMETIQYPFTVNPWVKLWSILPPNYIAPLLGPVKVSSPYNYVFSDVIPSVVSDLAVKIINGATGLTPTLGTTMLSVTDAGLLATNTGDIWGLSKNVLLYIKPTTLRYSECGFAVLINRTNIQQALFEIMSFYNQLIEDYKANNTYPINGPVEIRATGLNSLVGLPDDSQQASIGTLLPPTFPNDYDCAIWFDILTFPGTPCSNEFLTKVQSFFMATFNGTGSLGLVRPEWSKGWAYTNNAAYINSTILNNNIPSLFPNWNFFVQTFQKYDPYNVYSNAFLDTFVKIQNP